MSASSINVVAKTPSRLQRSLETQVLKVQEIVVHENFTWIKNSNDIALLKLRKPIILDNKWAAAITLPAGSINESALCTVLGWGKLYPVCMGRPIEYRFIFKSISMGFSVWSHSQ